MRAGALVFVGARGLSLHVMIQSKRLEISEVTGHLFSLGEINQFAMPLIDDESPAHCSPHRRAHTHIHVHKHIQINYFLIRFFRPHAPGRRPYKRRVETRSLRHGLVDGLHAVAHGELVHDLLVKLVKVDLPGVVALRRRDFHHAASLHVGGEVEHVLRRESAAH